MCWEKAISVLLFFQKLEIDVTTVEMENVLNMPRRQKLQMMEMLWEDLSRKAVEQETPGWHRQALQSGKGR